MAANEDEFSSRSQLAPSWLLSTFVDAVYECGSTAPLEDVDAAASDLISRWTAPGRHFHNQQYLAAVLPRIDEVAPACHEPAQVRLALWFYGAAIDHPLNCEDTARLDDAWRVCCVLVKDVLVDLRVPARRIRRICELTRVLIANWAAPGDVDASALLDANLSVFAATPQEYKRSRLALRKSLNYLGDEAFLLARRRFLRCLRSRDRIFTSPLGVTWESSARQNIEAELSNLEDALTELGSPSAGRDDAEVVDSYCAWGRRDASAEEVIGMFAPEVPSGSVAAGGCGGDSAAAPHLTSESDCGRGEMVSFDRVDAAAVEVPPAERGDRDLSSSSLELFPEVLERPTKAAAKRLSAKEQARASRLSNR